MPTLDLCVIAKNSAATLKGCLTSAKRLVDSILVVDTGSMDNTVEIAQQCGARVLLHPWCDDFAAVRNTALSASNADWILVLDADEELDAEAHRWIRRELRAPRADAYITPVRNYLKPRDKPLAGIQKLAPHERHPLAPEATHFIKSEVVRLYRRDPEVFYVGHVHEQVEYRLMELGRTIGRAGFFIHHFGWYRIDAENWKRKQALYTSLLAEKHRQRPQDALVMLQYGDALCAWGGKVEEGLSLFMRAAELNSKLPDVWLSIALALLRLDQKEAALIAMDQMSREDKVKPRVAAVRADILAALQRWEEARAIYREVLEQEPEDFSMAAKLALLEMDHGFRETGLQRMESAIARAEAYAAAQGRALHYLHAAELHLLMKHWTEARLWAARGLAIDATSQPLHALQLRAAVAESDLHAAASAAAALAELAPAPRSFLRHAAILHRSGEMDAARDVLSRGLARFPGADMLVQAQKELRELSMGEVLYEADPATPPWPEEKAAWAIQESEYSCR